MSSQRGFDPQAVVDAAMMLFWKEGYDEVSYDRLVAETGASRKGLYAHWPQKQALLVASLKRYREAVGDAFLAGMERADSGAAEVAEFWEAFETAARKRGWRGCFIMRTAADAAAQAPAVAAEVRRYLARLSAALETALRGAAARGEISMTIPPEERGRAAFAVVVACSTLGASEGFSPRLAGLIQAGRSACLAWP